MHDHAWLEAVQDFAASSRFRESGGVITDLDGTAIHEHEGQVVIPDAASHALKQLSEQGHPIAINTLRFPMSVIRTFGRAWYAITNAPLPIVTLNGSLIGYLKESSSGAIVFEEIDAQVLSTAEVEDILAGIESLISNGIDRLLVFYYPRDWRLGECIWTPLCDRLTHVRQKYLSASEVFCGSVDLLRRRLTKHDVCMMFLLVEQPLDNLMAYQHVKPANFITSGGIDKREGMNRLAAHLAINRYIGLAPAIRQWTIFWRMWGLPCTWGSGSLHIKDVTGPPKYATPWNWDSYFLCWPKACLNMKRWGVVDLQWLIYS